MGVNRALQVPQKFWSVLDFVDDQRRRMAFRNRDGSFSACSASLGKSKLT